MTFRTTIAAAFAALLALAGPARAEDDSLAPTDTPLVVVGADDEPDGTPPAEGAPSWRAVAELARLTASPVHGLGSSGFGWRDDPIRHRPKFHRGADYRAPRGTPVHAAGDGTVVACGRHGGYGRLVAVDHGGGVVTRYGHLSRIEVRCGDHVDADEVVGRVGSTGRATGPHLHFEVRIDGRAVHPTVAIMVGTLARTDAVPLALAASLALDPTFVEHSVSTIDPPGSHRRHKKPAQRRRGKPRLVS